MIVLLFYVVLLEDDESCKPIHIEVTSPDTVGSMLVTFIYIYLGVQWELFSKYHKSIDRILRFSPVT